MSHNIGYYTSERLPNSIGIVPYCGQDWRTQFSKSNSKLVYLIKTVASMVSYVDEVHVYHTPHDKIEFLKDHFDVHTHLVDAPQEIDNDVMVHPVGKYALLEDRWKDFDYVFFNESDQVVFSKNLLERVSQLGEAYLSPHRLERDFQKANCRDKPVVIFNDISYVHFNLPIGNTSPLVRCKTFWESYGAAWVARSSTVALADFRAPVNNGLHAPCLAMFQTVPAFKTKSLYEFFVDHLSGYRNALEKAGHDIENYPHCW